MKNLNNIAEELFNKIRGRFPKITIGDTDSVITNDPKEARFFDFELKNGEKVNVSLDDEAVTVMYNNKLFDDNEDSAREAWYDFLKELRQFSRKRMLNFDTRDITKSNLDKRDYEYLAKERGGETTMSESKMYGTSRTSFQDIGNARMIVKHSEPVNQELASGRSQKIHSIYVENSEGERFKYPFKHLNGARAVARHVSEGGNPYDDIGQHIVGLSEELSKLRKFKTYMNRSTVMAEGLSGYMDVVYDRINTVKKTIESLQKENTYKQFVETFEVKEVTEVPEDIQTDWIDQLTIRQFNEELKGVFPYIYKLVSEANAIQELGPEDLVDEGERHGNDKMYDKCWDGYKKVPGKKRGEKGSCVKEEDEFEAAMEAAMGQFSEAEDDLKEAYIKSANDAIDTLGNLRKIGKSIETGDGEYEGNLAGMYVNDVYDVISWVENNLDVNDPKYKQVIDPVVALRKKAKGMERETGSGKDARFGNEIVNTLYPLMQWIESAAMDAKEGDELEKEQKTPLGEFILSYFDRETGQFPKGETAVLTMIEKDYGEEFIEPAKQFIEQINNKVAEVMGYKESDMDEGLPDDGGLGVLEKLLQGITKDFVKGDDSAAQKMVDMLKKYNAPMDKVADMLEQQAKKLTKKTFGIFDNPLKKTPAGDAADRMVTLADYIRSKANESSDLERIKRLAGQ